MRAARLPSRGRLPPSRGQHVCRAGRGPRDAHSRAMLRCCAQSRQEPWSFRLLPQPLPGRGVCPARKVRVSLRGSATGREAPVRHVLLSVSQVQFRAAASRGAQVGSALLAQWPLNRRLVSQRSGDLFSGAGASFCGLGQGACRSLRFPTGRGAGWLGSAFFQTRAPQSVGAASGQKVLRARWSSGTGKPRFSGFRCGPSQSLCLSVPRLDLPEGSVSWRIFKRNCLESHSFFAFSNS